jgi:hypothetical protein
LAKAVIEENRDIYPLAEGGLVRREFGRSGGDRVCGEERGEQEEPQQT